MKTLFRELTQDEIEYVTGASERVWRQDGGRSTYYKHGAGFGWGGTDFQSNGGYNTYGSDQPSGPPLKDCEVRTYGTEDLGGGMTTSQQEAVFKLANRVEDIIQRLGELGEHSRIFADDPGVGSVVIETGEVYKLLSLADWKLMPENTDFGNSGTGYRGAGAADRNDGNPAISVDIGLVERRAAQSPAALDAYVLHEIAHTTQSLWDMRSVGSGDASFRYEQFTNSVAAALASLIGVPFNGYTPPLGFRSETEVSTVESTGTKAREVPICE